MHNTVYKKLLVLASTKFVACLPASDFPSENHRPQTRNFPYTNTLGSTMKKLSFTLIFSLISTLTFACSCSWTNFLKASKNSELIIKAKVLKHNYYLSNGKLTDLTNVDSLDYSGHSITVELTEIIKGTEKRNIFEIYGGNGWDCRP